VDADYTVVQSEVNKEKLGVKEETKHKHPSVEKVEGFMKEAKQSKRDLQFLYHVQS